MSYVAACYGITGVTLLVYLLQLQRERRRLRRDLPSVGG